MAPAGSRSPEAVHDDTPWRTAGDRIQSLLDASAASGPLVHERTRQLAGELTDLYGAALTRILAIASASAPELEDLIVADDLVASLLLVHGLHPHSVQRRIEDALDGVRPYLGSHGGDVALLDVAGSTVRLQFAGSCQSCPSSAVTLEFAVRDAVLAAAPEVTAIEVVPHQRDSAPQAVIPTDSLMTRLHAEEHAQEHAAWFAAPDLDDLGQGEVGGFVIAGVPLLACRVGDQLFAYHDRCGRCGESLSGAVLHRPVGAPVGAAVLRCGRCGAHFDAVHAGATVDRDGDGTAHLEPVPLLRRDGVVSVAVLANVTGIV